MSQTQTQVIIKHTKTIKIKLNAHRSTLTAVPSFVPKGLISDDTGNALMLGDDDKLYINPLTKQDW